MNDDKLGEVIIELKTEVRFMGQTLLKVEKVLENQGVLLEKQNVANKRITNLELKDEKFEARIRTVEDWKIKSIAYATILATFGSSIVGIVLNKVFNS